MRRRRIVVLFAVLALAVALVAGRPARAEDAAIVEQKATWEMSYGAVYYSVHGFVQNKSQKPIHYVKLQLELLDASGNSVYAFSGYNQKAETLGDVEGEGAGGIAKAPLDEKLKKIEALQPGEKDLFRIGISKDDIPKKPKFKSYSVKIVEVR
jgi:hypothetical protein